MLIQPPPLQQMRGKSRSIGNLCHKVRGWIAVRSTLTEATTAHGNNDESTTQRHNTTNTSLKTMVKFSGMSLVLTALAATRSCAAFGVGSLRTASRPITRLAASDSDFDDFSSKVRGC